MDSSDRAPNHSTPTDERPPIEAVHALVAEAGVRARRLRRVLALLTDEPRSLDELVRHTAVPRRTVEQLLTAAGTDVLADPAGYRFTEDVRDDYRRRFQLDDLDTADDSGSELEVVRRFIDTGPPPRAALDHVSATPETVLRRATWLRDTYDLPGAHVLLLGDHDLTSLALGLLVPTASVTVVDVDDRILAHIDDIATEFDLPVRTLHADLRFGLPPLVEDWADLVFTDPPYTPEGVGLFAGQGASALRGPHGRVLIAYGFSDRTPALGQKVQQHLLRAGMVFEAILPDFHRYHGAQAIGSASDLYVCLPTSRARKQPPRPGIYTHGPQSVEAAAAEPAPELLHVLGEHLGTSVTALRGPGWSRPLSNSPAPAFDLRADPGAWLLRMLLACNAERAVYVVDDHHPDITSEAARRELSELVAPKYQLRFVRNVADSGHALVVASVRADAPMRGVLRRAHGKLGNTWREALIAESGGTLTRRDAAQRVRQLAPNTADLELRLIDLPRHRIKALLRASGAEGC